MQVCSVLSRCLLLRNAGLFSSVKVVFLEECWIVQFCQGGCCSVLSRWLLLKSAGLFSSVKVFVIEVCRVVQFC